MFALCLNIVTTRTFDNFQCNQDMFNDRMNRVFKSSNNIGVDELTLGWHGKDEKRVDGPPAHTHMMGTHESVSFMFKNLACVKTGLIFAIDLQEGNRWHRRHTRIPAKNQPQHEHCI